MIQPFGAECYDCMHEWRSQRMSQTTTSPYHRLVEMIQEGSLLGATGSILGWDHETMMPEGGLEYRSRQMAQLARLGHQMRTAPEIRDLLDAADEECATDAQRSANIREIRRDFEQATKLPSRLVEEIARASSIGQHDGPRQENQTTSNTSAHIWRDCSNSTERRPIAWEFLRAENDGTHSLTPMNRACVPRISPRSSLRCVILFHRS